MATKRYTGVATCLLLTAGLLGACKSEPGEKPGKVEEKAPVAAVAEPESASEKDPTTNERAVNGLKLYLGYCFICHGQSGRGDGPYARTLSVKPANLADRDYFAGKTDKEIHDVISKGGVSHGKSIHMRPLGMQLSYGQIEDIVAYIRVLNRGVPVELEKKSGYTASDIYGMSCIMCHGKSGEGDGEVARKLGIAIRPLGGSEAQSMSDDDLRTIISEGIADPARPNAWYMPRWKESLTGEQIDELVRYVRSLKK
ncbi:c-type cytochrome [Chlorobaculum thiosulfatiphilum]|uniref:C-type cytochrome n=1 Tax=Chlorobaculum thiosulfatiphilum TaxID=115852 RepID=A0A5C4S9N3_CHLTI|nr:c-type cytochrome [Chlorobaculum thiosulfatiphilum]TNJ40273.1 c-type cytochrome [Chlorobaculum thiosulfatiphilum]